MQDTITYRAISFGRRAQTPDEPAVCLKSKAGDCKAQTLLLHGLLKAAGIPSFLALQGGWLIEDVPDLDQFGHMIVYVPGVGEGGTFIDTTNRDAPALLSGRYSSQSWRVLVLDPQSPRLQTVPALTVDENTLSVEREVRVAPSGDATVQETVRITGGLGVGWRSKVLSDGEKGLRDAVKALLNDSVPRTELTACKLTGGDDAQPAVTLRLTYTVPRAWKGSREQWRGQAPTPWEDTYDQLDPSADRTTPFQFIAASHVHAQTMVKAEAGAMLPAAAAPVSLETPAVRASATVKEENGAAILTYDLQRAARRYPAAQFAEAAKAGRAALELVNGPIDMKRP